LEIIFGSIFNIYHSTPIYVASLMYHPGCRGCKSTPKSFDLVKIPKKSVEIWAKSLKTFTKSLKIWANSWNLNKNGAQRRRK